MGRGSGGRDERRKEGVKKSEEGWARFSITALLVFQTLFLVFHVLFLKQTSIPKLLSRARKYPKYILFDWYRPAKITIPLPSEHVKLWQLPQLTSFHSKLCPTPRVWTQSSSSLKSLGWFGAQYVKLLDWLPAQTNVPSVSLSFSPIQPFSPLRRCWT